jgi:hypothetical protein
MANLTTQNIKDVFSVEKSNLGGAGDTEFLQWTNFLNRELYEPFIDQNPENYLSKRFIKTIQNDSDYELPSDYQDNQVGGVYKTQSDSVYGAINFDTETVPFSTIPQTITGGTSGATGILAYITDYAGGTGTLVMTNVSGTFQDNETLTGSSEGSATSNGTLYSFDFTDNRLSETGFGSSDTGYWIDGTNINITPTPDATANVYVLKYIPVLAKLTNVNTETIIPVRFEQEVQRAMEVFYEIWRQDPNGEIAASQRSTEAVNTIIEKIKQTPRVMRFKNRRSSFV